MPRTEIPYVVQNPETGRAVAGATVNIYLRGQGVPSNTLADVYTDETGTSKYTQPLSSNAQGAIAGWLDEGSYTMAVSGSDISPFSQPIESISGRSLASIDGARLTEGTVTGDKIANGSISLADLADSLKASLLPTGSVVPFAGSTAPSGFLLCQGQAVSRSTYSALYAVLGNTYGAGDNSTTFNLPDMRGRVPMGVGQGPSLTNRALGAKDGVESVSLTQAQMPVHTHSASTRGAGAHNHNGTTDTQGWHAHRFGRFDPIQDYPVTWGGSRGANIERTSVAVAVDTDGAGNHSHNFGTSTVGDHSHIVDVANSGSGTGHSNVQPSIALSYIIKV